jgi:hypothetical protein
MSKDRVIFWPYGPAGAYQNSTHTRATQRALIHGCGIDTQYLSEIKQRGMGIICRPSQFARFTIARAKFGGQNQMQVLQSMLVTEEDAEMMKRYSKIIDATRLPHTPFSRIYSVPSGSSLSYGDSPQAAHAVEAEVLPSTELIAGEVYELTVSGAILRIKKTVTLTGHARQSWLDLKPRRLPSP